MASETGSAERLQQLRKRIEKWRLRRSKQGPMPGELWDEATWLARSLGVSSVSRALGLGYQSLQQRVRGGARSVGVASQSTTGFIELSGAQLAGALSEVSGPIIELVAGDGARMTVRLPTGSAFDVAGLVSAFRGRPA